MAGNTEMVVFCYRAPCTGGALLRSADTSEETVASSFEFEMYDEGGK
jgi:hypothetical protein